MCPVCGFFCQRGAALCWRHLRLRMAFEPMLLQAAVRRVRLVAAALRANVRPLAAVHQLVHLQIAMALERLRARGALEAPDVAVRVPMAQQIAVLAERATAFAAHERPHVEVDAHVQLPVRVAREARTAQLALEPLGAGVSALVLE